MSKHLDKLSKLTDDVNKTIAALELPIKGVAIIIEWDPERVPVAEAKPSDLPGGMLAYADAIPLKSVLTMQKRTAEFTTALTEMALNAVLEKQEANKVDSASESGDTSAETGTQDQ
jgi:hypothetical protein